ncbi:3,4-dioxygenase subunit beta [Asanoa ishikariensis]|uniref:Protocatechuate 3,4-dioxygenase beta subunit n=1 Tax=Asanoa ishikariensis TaxID=137265 RepID=A0A1H3N011_9ACTN|nr:intradiol ring-cleavage dioxygenase [Asanoa ishikariensis]GIF68944.1 3,4-dioxygenase subunit beta [Asanoa ishikariensis]SDY82128.1 Protocatechuate 3,4-dioxygenase beta subunit [Asanoa ishikariensis]
MHQHDQGLSLDLPTLLSRRRVLGLFTAAGAVAVAGCAPEEQATSTAPPGPGQPPGQSQTQTAEGEIPVETAGPFPGDGSNGVNVLTESGIVRSDLTRSFGTASGVATGVPLTIALAVVDTSGSPRPGAAVYLWHCDQQGRYSLYSNGVEQENYLRGVQVADAAGKITFTSVYPAAYDGRWPHIHFEVYATLAKATGASDKLRTSQLALPEDASAKVYATSGYEQSVRNMGNTSLETDMVFSDGYSLQLGTVTGDVEQGLTVTLSVPV